MYRARLFLLPRSALAVEGLNLETMACILTSLVEILLSDS